MSLATGTPVTGGQQLQQGPALSDIVDKASGDGDATPRGDGPAQPETQHHKDGKPKKRSLFGFGKKKGEVADADADAKNPPTSTTSTSTAPRPPALKSDSSKVSTATRSTGSPTRSEHPILMPASPGRAFTGSPRLSSPSGSQIFERDVDTVTALKPQSPAIPNHIQTENHIPPVLDASSEAITNERLDPDTVEIVTHAQHQPASVAVTGATGASASQSQLSYEQLAASWSEDLGSFAERDTDNASNYGSLDNADIRRLSFISFADVVQAEHTGAPAASRESMHLAGLTSLSANRSPSPVRSPVSSQDGPGTSPPTSNPGSVRGLELSPSRKPVGGAGSPISVSTHHPVSNGEINIETMSQALRRTGSKDFGAVRSFPVSPVEGPSR